MKKVFWILVLVITLCLTLSTSTFTLAKDVLDVKKNGATWGKIGVGTGYHLASTRKVFEYPPCPPLPDPCPDPIETQVDTFIVTRLSIRNINGIDDIRVTSIKMYDVDGNEWAPFDLIINNHFTFPKTLGPYQSMTQNISPRAWRDMGEEPPPFFDLDPAPNSGRCFIVVEWESDGPVLRPSVAGSIILYEGGHWIAPGMWTGNGPTYKTMSTHSGRVLEEVLADGWNKGRLGK